MLICSCTYKESEKDKFPKIPYFPSSSNAKYKVEAFPFSSYSLQKANNYIYASAYDSLTDSHPFIVFDLNLNQLKTFDADVFYIHESDGFYEYDGTKLFRYSPPHFKKELLKTKKIVDNTDSIRTAYLNSEESDTLRTEFFVGSIFNDVHQKKLETKDLKCIVHLSEKAYILRYEDYDYLVTCDTYAFRTDNWTSDTCTEAPFLDANEIGPFDEVNLGFDLQGSNHIAFGVTLENLYYYRLKIDSDTILFKSRYGLIKELKTENGETILQDGKHNLYRVKKAE